MRFTRFGLVFTSFYTYFTSAIIRLRLLPEYLKIKHNQSDTTAKFEKKNYIIS